MQKLFEGAANVLNVPRSLMASFDLSAPLRQGVFLIGRPKQWGSSFKNMFKAFASEDAYKALQQQIKSRPTYTQMRQSNLAITDLSSSLKGREEAFMSNLAEKIPIIGRVVRASGRAYTGFLTKLRADTFDDILKSTNGKYADDIAKFVNSATGRGDLGALNRAAVALNSLLFSPRLVASRLNLINPVFYTKLAPPVRKEALKSLFTFLGTGMTVLTLAELSGAEVGKDPRSADFGKIKIGNTRIDIWGGFQQQIKLAAQLMSGQLVSSTTGKIYTLGEGYRPLTRLDILQRAAEYKEAPIPSFVTSLLRGQTLIGEPLSIKSETAKLFVPLAIKDIFEIIKEHQAKGIPLAPLPFFGIGVQTYKSEPKKKLKTKSKRKIREPILPKGFK